MIPVLSLQSEMYPPTGSIAAEGVKNQLGRPNADRLSVMVREAVQNSWDARAGSGAVEFGLHCWQASPEQLRILREHVFRSTPPETALDANLSQQSGYFLAVYDRRTVGLGGPTRADVAALPDEKTDFVDFLRNIGQPPDHEFGGGTYGYGKAAFYMASHVRAICVHTRCNVAGGIQSRFLSAGLGNQYTHGDAYGRRRFTGRHWWGQLAADGIVDPVLDADADAVAAALGLPGYPEGGRGTTILLPFPNFEERDARKAVAAMRRAILRYFWPKMMDGTDGAGTMVFRLAFDGEEIPIPHPRDVPELVGFAASFDNLFGRTPKGLQPLDARVTRIDCRNPTKHLGTLSLTRYVPVPRTEADIGDSDADGEDALRIPACHHVALMRTPHFAVRYLAGPPVSYEQLEYAGIFIADQGADAVFARSEPPTHDDWVVASLESSQERTFVRVAFRRVNDALLAFTTPPSPSGASGPQVPLGGFADQLASLIPAEKGPGAAFLPSSRPDTEAGGTRRPGAQGAGGAGGTRGAPRNPRPARVTVVDSGRVDIIEGVPVVLVEFDIEHLSGDPVTVRAEAGVILEGGSIEAEAPVGSARPSVVEWLGPKGQRVAGTPNVQIGPDESGRWSVAVSIPEDAMVGVTIGFTS
jgi:hypothetical protein